MNDREEADPGSARSRLPARFGWSAISNYASAGVDMAVSIPMDTFGCGLVALQRYDLLNATLIVVAICQAVAWTIVLGSGGGLLALGIVTVVISLVGQASRYVLLRRLVPSFSLSPA